MTDSKRKVAFWFRYSPADDAELCPAMPGLIEKLSETCEVHYFGLRGSKPVPDKMKSHACMHLLPMDINRGSTTDKILKMIAWYLCLPIIGIRCRMMGIKVVCINDYIPLGSSIARLFFGRNVVIWVADFLHLVYAERMPLLKPLARLISKVDFASWRKCPVIFTLVKHTRSFLVEKGIPYDNVHPVYDPCDLSIYKPIDSRNKRKELGYADNDIVIVHHGILHPNKGLHKIIPGLTTLIKKHANLHLLLIGSGPEESSLKKMINEAGISENVIFTGWLKTVEEVNEAINCGDIALVMRAGNVSDNFHTTSALTHSMAAGLPILSARLAGISEIIDDGRNGFLFNPDDMNEFRSRVEELIAKPELRSLFAGLTLEQARTLFDIDHVVRNLSKPILDLCHKNENKG